MVDQNNDSDNQDNGVKNNQINVSADQNEKLGDQNEVNQSANSTNDVNSTNEILPPPPIIQTAAEQPSPVENNINAQNNNPQQPQKLEKIKGPKHFNRTISVIIVIVIALIASFAVFSTSRTQTTSTTITVHQNGTVSTTTISGIKLGKISSCGVINSSGTYYLSGNITPSKNSSCIEINSNNVQIECNKSYIKGSGPYVDIPPFTYGILLNKVNNVSINKCNIGYFSFGVFERSSTNTSITNSNVSNNYISNIRLNNSKYNNILNNYISKSESFGGAVSLLNNSTENKLINNFILFNAEYGFIINSTANSFINNTVSSTPISFYCSAADGIRNNNSAIGNDCYNNTGCNFVECKGINIPTNVTTVRLGSRISSCGTIGKSGNYYLYKNINMSNFVNLSYAYTPCIYINASNVGLNCNNFKVYNTNTAIEAKNVSNVSIKNCNVGDSKIGISFEGVTPYNLSNIKLYNNSYKGLNLDNSSAGSINYINATDNQYGVYISNGVSSTINRFNLKNNTFGLYINNSFGNSFTNGYAFNNSKVDIYATPESANQSANFLGRTACGVSDALWAHCNQYISPNLLYFPVISCKTINKPGDYKLTNNIVEVGGRCISINSNNVVFSCNNLSISGAPGNIAQAIYINNKSNVSVNRCDINGFNSGIYAGNSNDVSLLNNTISNSHYGINASNLNSSVILNNSIEFASRFGIYLSNTIDTNVKNNSLSYGLNNIAIYLLNSTRNSVLDNKVESTSTGIYINGSSNNNTVGGNLVNSNLVDYNCSEGNSGINAEQNGTNYGVTKSGCHWLAALSPSSEYIACGISTTPSIYTLTSDYLYQYGSLCFGVYSKNTQINCNNHTIIATNGGTFALFKNSQNSELSRCYLKGFTAPIIVQNSSVKILNNTIYINSSKATTSALNSNSSNIDVSGNKVLSPYYGFDIRNSYGTILYNNITSGVNGYILNNVSNSEIQNNIASYSNASAGILLINSTSDSFKNNNFFGIRGFICSGSSQNKNSNLDYGSNNCTNNLNCNWINASQPTCPIR